MGGGLSRVCRPFFAIFGWKRPGKRSKTAAEKAEKPRYINGSQALPPPRVDLSRHFDGIGAPAGRSIKVNDRIK